MTWKKFLDEGQFSPLRKSSLINENYINCGKFTFLNWEKITGPINLKTNASFETIKIYLLSPEQNVSSFTFFAADKINIIFI